MPRKLQSRDPRSEKPAIRKGQTELRESRVIGKNDPKFPKSRFGELRRRVGSSVGRIVSELPTTREVSHRGSNPVLGAYYGIMRTNCP
jgi:hypothetical protein